MEYDAIRKLQQWNAYVNASSPSSHIERISKTLLERVVVMKELIKFHKMILQNKFDSMYTCFLNIWQNVIIISIWTIISEVIIS